MSGLSVEEARSSQVCRICGHPIRIPGLPLGWQDQFDRMAYPVDVTLNYGREFAHTDCLGPPGEDGTLAPAPGPG